MMTFRRALVALAAVLACGSVARAETLGSQQAAPAADNPSTALTFCQEADHLSGDERQRVLQRGLELAEAAEAADPYDAKAHFAVICNLGKQLEVHGPGLHDVMAVGRLKSEIDTALALSPGDPNLLASKDVLVLSLPRFLVGDTRQGEELLRATLVQNPDSGVTRLYLSK